MLGQEQWHITRTAGVLGIHQATLYRKILALDLRPDNWHATVATIHCRILQHSLQPR